MQAERRRWSLGFALRGGELAGAGQNGAPGLGLACGLAGEGLRGARDPLVASARGDGDRTWLRDGGGGSARRGLAGATRSGSTGATAYLNQHKKGPEGGAVTYRGSGSSKESCRGSGGEDRRWRRAAFADVGDAELLRLRFPTG